MLMLIKMKFILLSYQCKIRLRRFVTFVQFPFSVRLCDLFVASLVFMKGISCCIIRRNFSRVEPLDWVCMLWQILRGHRSAWWFPLLSACCFAEFDTYVISHVWAELFWLIYIAKYVFRSPSICFWGTKSDVYCENVYYTCVLYCDAGSGCD